MNIAAPDCIMEAKADERGQVTIARVCSWCEKQNNETGRLHLWCESVGITQANVTHGICLPHQGQWARECDALRDSPIDPRENSGRT